MSRQFWTDNEIEILQNNYGRIPTPEIIKLLQNKWKRSAIYDKANSLGIKGSFIIGSTKYSSDTTFFDEPNIQNSYWAGYIAADGCLKKRGGLTLSCVHLDRELIDNFKEQAQCTNPIKDVIMGERIIEGNKVYCKNQVRIDLWSQWRWRGNLEKYWNITPKKSLTLQPPNLTDQLLKYAYIIGYFDGDGWISYNKRKKITGIRHELGAGFCAGDTVILEWIKQELMILCPNESWKDSIWKHRGKTRHILWSGRKAINIHKSLKESVDIPWKLKRKWNVDYSQFGFKPYKDKNESHNAKST